MPQFSFHRIGNIAGAAPGLLIPAIAWAVAFAVAYAVQGAGCAAGLQQIAFAGTDLLRALVGGVFLVAIAIIAIAGVAALWFHLRNREVEREALSRFFPVVTALSAAIFLAATIWVALPVVVYAPCEGPLSLPS